MPASDPPKSKKQKTAPTAVGDFAVLPLTLLPLPGLPPSCAYAKHYLYVKAHTPSIPTETADRSLFLANVPADASESNIRLLFAEQLGGARVESVDFDSAIPAGVQHKRFKAEEAAKGGAEEEAAAAPARGKKRKRGGAGEMLAEGVRDDAESALPSTWGSELRKSGGCAVVVFVDRTSFRGAWKEVARASKEGVQLEWKGGENLGAQRYKTHLKLLHPAPSLLQSSTNAFLAQFDAQQAQRNRRLAHLRSVPDEDGFITVTRGGGRNAPSARLEIAQQKQAELEERKKKKGTMDGFYRFQHREKRKEEEGRLRKQFEKDRRRVQEMRERRGAVRPET